MKTVFITSRGGTHPIHKAYAESIEADFQFIDFKLPWHGVPSTRLKKYLSWIICALTFPDRKKYDVFLVSGQHVMPILMKLLGRLETKQKLVCFHANEGLFFTASKKYGKINRWLMKTILSLYDAHICVGYMQTSLLKKITFNKTKEIYTIENGIPKQLHSKLISINPDLESKKILFIGNLYAGWRSWYKGIDLMINAAAKAIESDNAITFRLVGEFTDDFRTYFDSLVPQSAKSNIWLCGPTKDVLNEFTSASLYLHCGRGDAFPTTTLEAMAAGIPCILSEFTGTYHLIETISPENVTELDSNAIGSAIKAYFNKSAEYRIEISSRLRALSHQYLLEDRIEAFKSTMSKLVQS